MGLFSKKNYNGITTKTPQHLQLGAGALFKNFVIGTDTYSSAKAAGKLLGATQGGGKFVAKAKINNISVDGGGSRVMGFADVSEWDDIHLEVNLIELTADIIRDELALADITTLDSGALTGYKKITGRVGIADTDYITNITWVGCVTGSESPMYIQIKNGFNEDGIDLTFQDGDAGVIACSFHAYNALTEFINDQVTAPFEVYYPPIAAETAIPTVTARATSNSVLLTWNEVPSATKYAVKSYSGGTYTTLDDTLTEPWFEVTSLSASTTYYYLVQAYVNSAWTPAENAANNIAITTKSS